MCPLSCISLASGRKFEPTLANEHIEDILHDKRMYWLTTATDMFKLGSDDTLTTHRNRDAFGKAHLVDWQIRMRLCFDYRMLRDRGD
jgi:hypothetical protein